VLAGMGADLFREWVCMRVCLNWVFVHVLNPTYIYVCVWFVFGVRVCVSVCECCDDCCAVVWRQRGEGTDWQADQVTTHYRRGRLLGSNKHTDTHVRTHTHTYIKEKASCTLGTNTHR
jgi:hypothetical protein